VNEVDPLRLDRDIARSARAERRWFRTLRADAGRAADDVWYEPLRYVTTRSTFTAVSSMSPTDPLRQPLRRWVHRLAMTRIAAEPILTAAKAWQEPTIRVEKPEAGLYSARIVVERVLAEREPARAALWLEALAGAAPAILATEQRLREATDEISSRLGVTDASELATYEHDALKKECEHLLRRTDDLASAVLRPDGALAPLLGKLVARDVPGVWPSRADARWLHDQFHATPLLEGLSLDLGPLKAPLGGSSFARALARFGAAYARAAVQDGGPFVGCSDASEAHPFRRGALFGSLVADPVFLRKQLQLSREAAAKSARALGGTLLAEVRLVATRTVTDFGRVSAREIAQAVESVLGVPIAPHLAGVLPRLSLRAHERALGSLLATDDVCALRSRYDEDWFKNPRGLLFLRESDAAPRPDRLPREALEGSGERLAVALTELAT
jgi:hypothetical protein